jgi:transaldolase
MRLRWFLDTADAESWQEWMPTGLFFGVTSNPLLLERVREPCTIANLKRLAGRAFELGAKEFHAQTWGPTADAMAETGFALAALDPRIVVKVPITLDGTRASARLIAKHVPVTTTALYAAHQAGTSMALGAAYAAPYLGRIDEAGRDGHGTVVSMQRMIRAMESPMRLLVASLRRVESIPALIEQGIDTFTLGPSLLPELFKDDATLAAARDFERAATSAASH